VTLADGREIPISRVEVGDMVLATDTTTGITKAERVTALWVNHDADLMNVTVESSSGTSTIDSTQHHLFWDLTTHSWTQAENLIAGDRLETPSGVMASVVSTALIPGAAYMWDLTVDNDHDFYVAVSASSPTAVLVHNCPTQVGNSSVPEDSDLGQAVSRGMQTTSNWERLAAHLEENYGVTPEQSSDALHAIKALSEGNPDVILSWSGGVYDATSGDLLGSLITG
jgi:hypothetical protein